MLVDACPGDAPEGCVRRSSGPPHGRGSRARGRSRSGPGSRRWRRSPERTSAGLAVVVAEVTTGDHSEGADGRERARLGAAQGVLAIAVANQLALGSTRQVDVTRERVARLTVTLSIVAVAGVPAGIVSGGAAVLVGLLPVAARTASERPRVIVATFCPRLVARVVEVSGIEIQVRPSPWTARSPPSAPGFLVTNW